MPSLLYGIRLFALPAAALAATLTTAPAPAQASSCEHMWFLRNLIAHRAGHCFVSTLGRAVFGNEGCAPGVQVPDADAARMQAVLAIERGFGCRVDVARPALGDPVAEWDWHVIDLIPVPSGFQSSCFGYRLSSFDLRAAPHADAPVVGMVLKGDSIAFNYEDEGDWMFLLTDAEEGFMGWAPIDAMPYDEDTCDGWAG